MSENAPAPELTPGQKRIAAAHAALAKKRAIAALEKLREERIDIEKKLAIESPTTTQEEKKIAEELPIQEEEKEIPQQQEESTQQHNNEKELPKDIVPMSSSEEIVIHELEKPKHDNTFKNKNKKKKKQANLQEEVNSKPILNERNSKRARTEKESSESSEDEPKVTPIRPRKIARVDNIKKNSDGIENGGTMGRIVNAFHGIRNITVPPVVSTVVTNSASTIGWAFAILAVSYVKAYMSSVTQSMERRPPGYNYPPPNQPTQQQQPNHTNQENQRKYNYPPQTDYRPFIPPFSTNRNYPTNHTPTSYNLFR